MLNSVYVSEGFYNAIADASQLPTVLIGPSNLLQAEETHETLNSFNTHERPIMLSAAFLQVDVFLLDAIRTSTCAYPWETCHGGWQVLHLAAALDIAFENVGSFLDSGPTFYFACHSLWGLDILQLGQRIAERRMKCDFTSDYCPDTECVMCDIVNPNTPYFVMDHYCDTPYRVPASLGRCVSAAGALTAARKVAAARYAQSS